jgi:hypothetical protein
MADSEMFDTQTKSIANSVILIAIARISMALSLPMLGLVVWLSGQWLEHKFEAQDAKIEAQEKATRNQTDITTSRIETVERSAAARIETAEKTAGVAVTQSARVNERLIAVETKQAEDRAASERFQNATLQRLDRLQDSVVSMSNAIAALTATLQASQKEPP